MPDEPSLYKNLQDPWVDLMIKDNIPLTRENYLTLMFMGDPPEWSPEYEDEIPAFLQDWDSKTFGPPRSQSSNQSSPSRHGFFSLTLEELEDLGRET
jgi:hypothetical protein